MTDDGYLHRDKADDIPVIKGSALAALDARSPLALAILCRYMEEADPKGRVLPEQERTAATRRAV